MHNGTVSVCYLHPGKVSACFMDSLIDLMFFDAATNQRIIANDYGKLGKVNGSGHIAPDRNFLAKTILDDSQSEWLFFVDSDMGFAPDTVERLLESADPVKRPVVGALAFANRADGTADYFARRYRMVPTVYYMRETDDEVGFVPMFNYPRDEVVKCDATGAACVLIHYRALQKVRDRYGDTWFDHITVPKGPDGSTTFGEDLSFCLRLTACDVPIHVDTSVKTTHDKGAVFLDEETFDLQQAFRRMTAAKPEPDIPVKVAAVIPVKDKLELTKHVVEQLRADEGVALITVLDNGSTDGTAEWVLEQGDVLYVDAPSSNIHEMWNKGIELSLELPEVTAVAILNNDLDLGKLAMSECAKALAVQPVLAAVCPNYDGRQIPPGGVVTTTEICAGRYDGTGGLAGFAMVLARDFAETYRFPEDCTWWYGDNDLVLTAQKHGRKLGIVGAATVEHLDGGGQTGDWMDPEVQEVLEADRQAFLAKWAAP